jgi:uncharacterized membrane protein
VTRSVDLCMDSESSNTEISSPSESDAKALSPRFWAILMWSLYLVAYLRYVYGVFWYASILGVIIAYKKRDYLDNTPFESHATSAIWTFWLYIAASFFGLVIFFLSDKMVFAVDVLLGLWKLFRSLRGVYLAVNNRDITDPSGWL